MAAELLRSENETAYGTSNAAFVPRDGWGHGHGRLPSLWTPPSVYCSALGLSLPLPHGTCLGD